jgi:PncC family amidohydrolase
MGHETDIGRRLVDLGWTVATAESCTGGLVGGRLTGASGSSRYFAGGVTAYANRVKTAVLGVDADVLEREGAVSAPVAERMAEGVRAALGVDVGVAVTGIAGPEGGSPEKPVGLVFVAVSGPGGGMVRRCMFSGDRETVRRQAADAALDLLVEYVNEQGGRDEQEGG